MNERFEDLKQEFNDRYRADLTRLFDVIELIHRVRTNTATENDALFLERELRKTNGQI